MKKPRTSGAFLLGNLNLLSSGEAKLFGDEIDQAHTNAEIVWSPVLGTVPFDVSLQKTNLLTHLANAVLDNITN